MRRAALSLALLALLGLLTLGSGVASAQTAIGLAPAGNQTFPERSYRVTVPARRGLLPRDVTVTENGERVSKLKLASADAASVGQFGSILVIDASSSMHGRAITSAMGAARVLAGQRTGTQQLGVIVFNRTPKVLLAPTSDPHAIAAALSGTPKLASQTHIFDAVNTAMDLLATANIRAGSIVVLSDGSDTGSQLTSNAVAARARKANVSIYSVGLRSGAFDSSGLKDLAAAGRGRYIPAESVFDLRRIFRDLGAQLAGDYLMEYRSFAQPGSEVTVAIQVAGVDGVATHTYRVPGGASFVQVKQTFWTSTLGAALTALLCTLLLAFGLGILLVRRRRAPTVRERISGFVTMGEELVPRTDVELTDHAPRGAERSLERTQWWLAFKEDIEIARIEIAPLRIVAVTGFVTVVLGWLLAATSGIALLAVFALAVPWGVRTWVRVKRDRQRAEFTEQLPDMLQGSASAIRAGHGLVAALSMVADDAPEPSRTEFLRVVGDEALGVPLDEALRVVQRRMDSRDVMQIALVAQIQRDAGGNMAEVLDRITESLRQSAELRRMVKALTAQGRMSRWVVTALPLALLLIISLVNPEYIRPLFTESLGLLLLAVSAVMMLMGSVVIGKIVNFKV
jgi:tight adherence protein B